MLALLLLVQEDAVARLKPADGFKVELVAADPDLVNPVSFCLDARGRFYVVETHRLGSCVYDVRSHMRMLDDDLAARTVEDRLAYHRKWLGEEFKTLESASERVRRLEDTDGDGRVDRVETFADGFNDAADGIAAGVLANGDDVYFTCIPNLWRLREGERKVLSTGYGVRIAFIGHDLHGLVIGPDGKLYFSIGDRGLHVSDAVSCPDSGAILRCNLDGSGLEIFATGLRNPQELAFDAYGNLWTGDNNNDAGDKARLVYVCEGADVGWRIGYQWMGQNSPWMQEEIWKAEKDVPYRTPAIAHIGWGPAGLAYYPGTGLPARYDGHFFMCDFPGGVRSFAVRPKGAGFEVVDEHQFLWELWPTDVTFGADGHVYVLDWVEGWGMPGKGRIFRVRGNGDAVDLSNVPADPALLEHRDMRVRQAAQFALVAEKNVTALRDVSRNGTLFARLHAIWGLAMLGEDVGLMDDDPEVLAQCARFSSDVEHLLSHENARVRYFAILSLGRAKKGADAILESIRDNTDPFLRHAAVMALTWIGDPGPPGGTREQNLVKLLALRRLRSPKIVDYFMTDLAFEAIRAIHDEPIPEAMAALASVPRNWPRVINANYRLGTPEAFDRLVEAQAWEALESWAEPSGRDRVVGLWRPLPKRDPAAVRERARPAFEKRMAERDVGALRAAAALGLDLGETLPLDGMAMWRVETMRALAAWKHARLAEAVERGLRDRERMVYREALRLVPEAKLEGAVDLLVKRASDGAVADRQAAIEALIKLDAVGPLVEQMRAGTLPAALWLDVIESGKAEGFDGGGRELLEGGNTMRGEAAFGTHCMKCHGGGVGPKLDGVGGRLSRAELLESILDPNAKTTSGYEQIMFITTDERAVTGRVVREDDREVVVLDADGNEHRLAVADIAKRKPRLSAMPEGMDRILTKREIRDVVEFLAGLR